MTTETIVSGQITSMFIVTFILNISSTVMTIYEQYEKKATTREILAKLDIELQTLLKVDNERENTIKNFQGKLADILKKDVIKMYLIVVIANGATLYTLSSPLLAIMTTLYGVIYSIISINFHSEKSNKISSLMNINANQMWVERKKVSKAFLWMSFSTMWIQALMMIFIEIPIVDVITFLWIFLISASIAAGLALLYLIFGPTMPWRKHKTA